ncbi:MAG: hypothetical protein CVV21_00350 [Candidatus Goldiibacteriota bacterium HGW-Goldbacteria-1]|jgi:4-amino-4-deoxy-L-arabinose transferase-like glycosyltransferase|nr:MAG: hypothetical protein CVV21_00350 [Candidatus Goldiibacteriota bacterium HGW-Goldbacteria-1]
MYCYKCNGKINSDHIFCPHCGVKVKSEPIVITEVYKVKEKAEKKPEESKLKIEKTELPAVKVVPARRLLPAVFSAATKQRELKQPAITQADVNPFMIISDNIGAAFVPAAGDFKKMLGAIGPFYIMALALFIVFAGQAMIFGHNSVKPPVYLWYVAASVIFLAAEVSYRYRRVVSGMPEMPEKSSLTAEIIYVSVIAAVAAFFRLYIINETPAGFAYDEATISSNAVEMITKGSMYGVKYPVYVGGDIMHAAFPIYIVSFVFKIFGAGIVQARATMAVIGIVSVVAVYFLTRRMFGVKTAFAVGIIFAVMRWHVNFSRISFYCIYGVLIGILAVYFIYMALSRKKTFDFVMMGALLGLNAYGYVPGRMLYPAVIVTALFLAVKNFAFYRENLKKIFISIGVFFIVFAPLGLYFAGNPSQFMARTNQTSLLNEQLVKQWFHGHFTREQAIKDTFKKTFQMFTRYGDQNPRHNIMGRPVLDYVTGGLAVLGLGFMLLNSFNVFYFFIISLFVFFLVPGLLTIEAPQSLRVIYSMIPIIIFVGLVINRFFVYAAEQFAGMGRKAAVLIALIGCGIIAGINYKDYFEVQAKDNVCWSNFDTIGRTAAEFVMSKGDDWYGIVDSTFANKPFYFLAREKSRKSYGYYSPSLVPFANPEGKNIYYLLGSAHKNTAVYDLPRIYPKGRLITVYEKYNSAYVHMYAFEVDAQEAMANRDKELSEGFYARYFRNERWEGYPSLHRVDSVLSFDWNVSPVDGPFSAEWTAYLQTAGGVYEFAIDTNNYADLKIDGKTVLTVDMKNSISGGNPRINLSAGTHKIKVRYMDNIGYSRIHLRWKRPGASSFEIIDPMFLKPLK